MELGNELFFWCGELIFARQREKTNSGVFFAFLGGVFAFFGGDFAFFGVISRFWGYFCAVRPLFRAQRDFFFELIFRNGAEQNGGLPPWRCESLRCNAHGERGCGGWGQWISLVREIMHGQYPGVRPGLW